MSAIPTTPRPAAASRLPRIGPPGWVADFVGPVAEPARTESLKITRTDQAALVSFRIEDAADRTPTDFLNAVREAYTTVFKHAVGRVVRCWNFVPDINAIVAGDQTRYMIFNAGRYAAFLDQFGPAENFDSHVPTASAVGTTGRDLWIHALSLDMPVTHMGNPRQVSPHLYSDRFGKRPPCFSRATRAGDLLLVGGTASIRGENSVYIDLHHQTIETLLNLRTVLDQAGTTGFESVTDVRAYHPRPDDAAAVRRSVSREFRNVRSIEVIQADLCRPELLIEIEVVAELKSDQRGVLTYATGPGLGRTTDPAVANPLSLDRSI
jgi:enamine deaminase RidA (YjgF/YER057c/UK114 family)